MKPRTTVLCVVGILTVAGVAQACTAFLAVQGDTVLVGNNEGFHGGPVGV